MEENTPRRTINHSYEGECKTARCFKALGKAAVLSIGDLCEENISRRGGTGSIRGEVDCPGTGHLLSSGQEEEMF